MGMSGKHFQYEVFKGNRAKIVEFKDAPKWLKDNRHLISGYRKNYSSFSQTFKTIFSLHNETLNIWTHLIGCVVFIIFLENLRNQRTRFDSQNGGQFGHQNLLKPNKFFQDKNQSQFFQFFNIEMTSLEVYPIVLYLSSVILTFLFSTIMHWFGCMSHEIEIILHKLDMLGIVLQISGSFCCLYYYNFYCQPLWKNLYSFCCVFFSVAVFIISLFDFIHEEKNVIYKSLMFAGLGLSNLLPISHIILQGVFASSKDVLPLSSDILWVFLMGAMFLTGLYFYSDRIPEKYYPRKFDIWCNSHVIWHYFVIAGSLAHFKGITQAYNTRSLVQCVPLK